MRNRLQIEEITDFGHEHDEIDDIAIGRCKILFEEDEDRVLLLDICVVGEAMGVQGKRKGWIMAWAA
jgi:hypothetical protein